jgi:hypothetical protein
MFAHIVTTPDISQAKQFPTALEAVETWRLSHGLRADGKPDRPLTAFTVEVVA